MPPQKGTEEFTETIKVDRAIVPNGEMEIL